MIESHVDGKIVQAGDVPLPPDYACPVHLDLVYDPDSDPLGLTMHFTQEGAGTVTWVVGFEVFRVGIHARNPVGQSDVKIRRGVGVVRVELRSPEGYVVTLFPRDPLVDYVGQCLKAAGDDFNVQQKINAELEHFLADPEGHGREKEGETE